MNDRPRLITVPHNLARGTVAGRYEENRVRTFAQSVLTHFFDEIPPLPSYDEAVDIMKWATPAM